MKDNVNKIQFSLEVFPPKDKIALDDVLKTVPEFVKLAPSFISVTYGAGGGTRTYTTAIADFIQNETKVKGVAHLTAAGATKESVREQLLELKQKNVTSILALRGDLKDDGQHNLTDFTYASDLIEFINEAGGFETYAACYPEGHSETDFLSKDTDILKLKHSLGVKHFISQLFFDNSDFYRMLDSMDKAGIDATVHAGIMPLTNVNQILRIVYLSGAKIPARLSKIVSRFEDKPEAFRQAGLNYALEQITDLIANGVGGVHLYSMNNPKIATYIWEGIQPLL